MMRGQTAWLWEGDPARGSLTWGETHSPTHMAWRGHPDSARQAPASTHPLFLVPPPLGGASGAESWLWGVWWPLPSPHPPSFGKKSWREGSREGLGSWEATEGRAGTLAPGAALPSPPSRALAWLRLPGHVSVCGTLPWACGPSLPWDPLRGRGEARAWSGSLGSQPVQAGLRAPCWRLGHLRSKQMSPEPLRSPGPTRVTGEDLTRSWLGHPVPPQLLTEIGDGAELHPT